MRIVDMNEQIVLYIILFSSTRLPIELILLLIEILLSAKLKLKVKKGKQNES